MPSHAGVPTACDAGYRLARPDQIICTDETTFNAFCRPRLPPSFEQINPCRGVDLHVKPPALAPIFTLRWDAFPYPPAVGWAGSRLLVTGVDTYLVDPRTRKEFVLPRDPSDWATPTVSPAGDVIVVRHDVRLSSRRSRPELSFHDLQGRQMLRAPGETAAFGRDGRTVAVSSGGETWASHQPSVDQTHTDVWRMGGTAPEFSVPGRRAAFDHSGTRLTTSSPDGRAWVWESAGGAPVTRVGDFVVLAAEIAGGRGAGGPEEPPPAPVQRFAVVRHPDRVTASHRPHGPSH